MSNILPENRKDSLHLWYLLRWRKYGISFVYNTDILCGIKDENMSLPLIQQNALANNQLFLSIEYLNKLYGYDITKSYVFDFCRYDENAGLFDVRFYKSLGSYKTDDEIKVWVRSDGSVAGFSAFNINRYDKYGDKALKIDEATKGSSTLETKTKSMNIINYRIKESYITLNDNGDLAYVNMIEYDIYYGTSILQECEKIEQIINIQ